MTFNESDLIAYQLNELSPRRARALQRALAADPALAAEAEAIAWTLRAFSHAPTATIDDAVLDRNWNSLRSSLPVLTTEPAVPFWRRPLALAAGLALAAAGIIGVAFLTTQHIPVRNTTTATNSAPTNPASSATSSTTASSGDQSHTSTILSSRSEAPSSAAGVQRTAGSLASAGSLRGTARNYATLNKDAAASLSNAEDNAYIARSAPAAPASRGAALKSAAPVPSNSSETVAVAAEPLSVAPPLRASITNSVPLHDSAQTLHTYSATTLPPTLTTHTLHQHETDISVGAFAGLDTASHSSFTTSSPAVGTQAGTQVNTQTTDPSVGILVAFHKQFRPAAGFQVAAGYTRKAFNTSSVGSTGNQAGLMLANAYEVSGAYAVAGPHTHRISTHATGGAAVLDFVPASPANSVRRVLRPAGLFTVGLDYHVKRHWSLRAEYRALFFKAPNFQSSTTSLPVIQGYTVASEPTISLNYRFDSLVRP